MCVLGCSSNQLQMHVTNVPILFLREKGEKKVLLFAHNLSSYDGIFLLNCLLCHILLSISTNLPPTSIIQWNSDNTYPPGKLHLVIIKRGTY